MISTTTQRPASRHTCADVRPPAAALTFDGTRVPAAALQPAVAVLGAVVDPPPRGAPV